MHIVLVSREYLPTLRGGGIASYIKEVAEEYVHKGHQVTIICASDDTQCSSDTISNQIRVIRLQGGDFLIPSIEGNSIIKKFRPFYRFHSYRKRVRKAILTLKDVDVIEVPEFGAESHYLYDLEIPVIVRLHTPAYTDRETAQKKKYPVSQLPYRYLADIEEKDTQRADYITSCSQSLKEWTQKYFHIPEDKITVIYNPIKMDYWTCPKKSVYSFSPKSNYHILYAGTVAEAKGVQDLIEACHLLRQQKLSINLTIVGKLGQYGKLLKQKYDTEKWCQFLGGIPREKLKEQYSQCDIACFPSWWENMPLVCIEAMACGCIVIGSSSGGMSEIIEDFRDGFLAPPQAPQQLADIIRKTINLTPEQKVKISHNAQEKAEQHFSSDVIIGKLINYYQFAINKHRVQR